VSTLASLASVSGGVTAASALAGPTGELGEPGPRRGSGGGARHHLHCPRKRTMVRVLLRRAPRTTTPFPSRSPTVRTLRRSGSGAATFHRARCRADRMGEALAYGPESSRSRRRARAPSPKGAVVARRWPESALLSSGRGRSSSGPAPGAMSSGPQRGRSRRGPRCGSSRQDGEIEPHPRPSRRSGQHHLEALRGRGR